MTRILVCGLPGSGKTTFTADLARTLNHTHTVVKINADEVRKFYNDWDFSPKGRRRQAQRMVDIANDVYSAVDVVILDFVCPLEELRDLVQADIIIWADTLQESRFEDTNAIFENPIKYDYRFRAYKDSYVIISDIKQLLEEQ